MGLDHKNLGLRLMGLVPLIYKNMVSAPRLKELGFTKSQLLIITALFYKGDLNMGQIAKHIGSSREQATRAVAPLVDELLVERFITDDNRTQIHVRLTERGHELVSSRLAHWADAFEEKLDTSVTEEEKQVLSSAIETISAILNKMN